LALVALEELLFKLLEQ